MGSCKFFQNKYIPRVYLKMKLNWCFIGLVNCLEILNSGGGAEFNIQRTSSRTGNPKSKSLMMDTSKHLNQSIQPIFAKSIENGQSGEEQLEPLPNTETNEKPKIIIMTAFILAGISITIFIFIRYRSPKKYVWSDLEFAFPRDGDT